ncbi:hypothetical protein [Streptomyces regalis]|uniref:Lipid/polyisoprenoid-binding YceI-like domain-containing protein n=1 Tax=Streptomyces regalis TaxID=68262 RepID=A0A117MPR0_9ACTN|nr:hypothetical protein [Streptomyces regalis]KUL29022.1 hypothetical protein ADL12_28390 [Streptomyces regalis]
MTTVTLPTDPTPPGASGSPPWLPLPGRYAVAPGRSLVELTALCGPLPLRRRRLTLAAASLTVPETGEHPIFRFEFDDADLKGVLTLDHAHAHTHEGTGTVQLTGDLGIDGTDFPALLRLRVVERAENLLLVVGTARLPYGLLRRATGFRFGRLRPTTRLRLLVAGEFA